MTPTVVEGEELKILSWACHGGLELALSPPWASAFPSVDGDNEERGIADLLFGPPYI